MGNLSWWAMEPTFVVLSLTDLLCRPHAKGEVDARTARRLLEWLILKAVVLFVAVAIYGFWLGRKDRDG
jgi:hypothetical protein